MAAWQNRSDIVELLIANGGKVKLSLLPVCKTIHGLVFSFLVI